MRPEYESSDGIFIFSLCDRCNNKTGHRYGGDYSSFVELVASHATPDNVNTSVAIDFSPLHPLRIVKQATSMMLSTSNPTEFTAHEFVSAPGRGKKDLEGIEINFPRKERQQELYEQLRHFVRLRDNNDLPSGVRIYLFASAGRRRGFSTGIFTRINLTTKSAVFAAATGLWPIHWIFTFDGKLDEGILDVTDWARFGYKETLTREVGIPMRWLEGHYPLDFRSPNDLYTANFINSMRFEGFVPSGNINSQELLSEALFFARTLGKLTVEGYLLSTFSTGTFYEFEDLNGWLEGADADMAKSDLEHRLNRGPR